MARFLVRSVFRGAILALVGCAVTTRIDISSIPQLSPDAANDVLRGAKVPPNWNYVQFSQSVTLIIYNPTDGRLGMQVQGGPGGFCSLPQTRDSATLIAVALRSLGSSAQFVQATGRMSPCL